MASLLVQSPGRPDRVVRLFRPLTTVGASPDSEISIQGAGLEATHAQLRRIAGEAEAYELTGRLRDLTVNGRRVKRCTLADGDEIRFGELCLRYFSDDAAAQAAIPSAAASAPGEGRAAELTAYQRLHAFSERLLAGAGTEALVAELLDAVVELTGADKGYLVLIELGKARVCAARGAEAKELPPDDVLLSDSILRQVMADKSPLIVADALADEGWSRSTSIVSLKLLSVMCCPLLDRGQLRGLLYLGNNRVSKRFDESSLQLMQVFSAQASLLLTQSERLRELQAEKAELAEELKSARFGSIVGACSAMQQVFTRVRKVATAEVSVLITGETGTGKELIARELHRGSKRAAGPFVVINCGAIPDNLLESELFGHVAGAFTGAVATRKGRFQAADGGTLFLDEIGELPMHLQVKLLRALQDHEVTKLGDTRPESVDIRVLAATNRVLEQEIAQGGFREDLYYRLNVVNIHLPPLRERPEDLELLASYFLHRAESEHGSGHSFSQACLRAMHRHSWPGNVRELENRVTKGVVMADGPELQPPDLDLRAEGEEGLSLAQAKERFVDSYIRQALIRNQGNRAQTARDLGVDPRTIFRHLERQGD